MNLATALVTRLNKATRVLLKIYPEAETSNVKSVFDKNFTLHGLLNSVNWKDEQLEEELHRRAIHELVADNLL